MIIMDNTAVFYYIHKQGGTHSHTLFCLVVYAVYVASSPRDNSQCKAHSRLSERDSRLPVMAKSANYDRVEPPPRNSEPNLREWATPIVDVFATVHNTHLPKFMFPILEQQALVIDALFQD